MSHSVFKVLFIDPVATAATIVFWPLCALIMLTEIFCTMKSSAPDEKLSSDTSTIKLGTKAKAITDLRPSGKVQIGVNIVSVITREPFIDAGSMVEVVDFEMREPVVKLLLSNKTLHPTAHRG
jgi:membrane-bound ClpP family serine protease